MACLFLCSISCWISPSARAMTSRWKFRSPLMSLAVAARSLAMSSWKQSRQRCISLSVRLRLFSPRSQAKRRSSCSRASRRELSSLFSRGGISRSRKNCLSSSGVMPSRSSCHHHFVVNHAGAHGSRNPQVIPNASCRPMVSICHKLRTGAEIRLGCCLRGLRRRFTPGSGDDGRHLRAELRRGEIATSFCSFGFELQGRCSAFTSWRARKRDPKTFSLAAHNQELVLRHMTFGLQQLFQISLEHGLCFNHGIERLLHLGRQIIYIDVLPLQFFPCHCLAPAWSDEKGIRYSS